MDRSSSSSTSSSSDQDWISNLPNDVLLMILSRLSIKEAIRTSVLSKRWEHVWKYVCHLVFDKPKILSSTELCEEPNPDDTLITKVINNHEGDIQSCVINYSSSQGLNGILNTWIQSLTSVKHTKVLTLIRHFDCWDRTGKVFEFPSNSFSHPSLMSLSLASYTFRSSHPFRNCSNLRTLKLVSIIATDVEVFNTLLSSCPSLEVLVLKITCVHDIGGPLKIENNKLKLLHVLFMHTIGGLQVASTSLDILVIENVCFHEDDFFLCAPRLQFSRKFFAPHISYNISKEEKSIGHEEFVNNISGGLCKRITFINASMSVSINLMNRTEVEKLRQVLGLWIRKMRVLEITFKDNNNAPDEASEKKLWEEDNDHNNVVAFPNAKFRVKTLWMPNFSGSEEEFAFASCLIKHGTVVDKMMIKTSSFSARRKLEIEAAVNKLRVLQTEEDQLMIKCF